MEEERHRRMVRTLTRNVICFTAAVVLLALVLCAVEISMRIWQLRSRLHSRGSLSSLSELIVPSRTSWIDVKPLVDVQRSLAQGPSVRIQTNEHGVRGPSVVVPKPRGTFRVLCLGGDNVFGTEIAERESLPGRLQRALNMHAGMPVEVINGGCPSAGPLINLLRYRAHLSTLQPDLVIVCLNEEDLSFDRDVRGALHLDESRNPAYAAHPGMQGQGCAWLDGLCEEFVLVDHLLSWAGEMAGMDPGSVSGNPAPIREGAQRDLAAIVPLASLVSGQFGHLVISASPSAWSVDRVRHALDQSRSSFAEDLRTFLKEVNLGDRVDVHDGLAPFCSVPDARSYFSSTSGGLSPAGNELYAQQLSTFLLQAIPGLGGTAAAPVGQSIKQPQPRPIPFPTDQSQQPAPATVIR